MTAVAEAIGTIERKPKVSASILYKNINLAREDYNNFYLKAKEAGVSFIEVDDIKVSQGADGNVEVSYNDKKLTAEMFILVPSYTLTKSAKELVKKIGLELNKYGFLAKDSEHPIYTSKEGIFVCGSVIEPKGIDDTIVQACASAADAAALLSPSRYTEMLPPTEKEIMKVKPEDEPKILVVICRCGLNIAGLLDMDELVNYTSSLPNVKHVEVTPFGCDGVKIRELLKTKKFNRLVLGACSPKTHEALFSLHTEMGGLNRYLMEIVNLRNQCTWVHSQDKKKATEKAKVLMRMGVKRVTLQEQLEDIDVSITPSCLVIGATPSGIACALRLAQGGFKTYLVEKEPEVGKIKGNDKKLMKQFIDELNKSKEVKIYTNAKIGNIKGYLGNFKVEIINSNKKEEVDIGAVVLATNADMKAGSDGSDFEKDLFLQRDESNFFIGALGILNQLDFNTEGVFKCGSARREMGTVEAIIDGEACASRVAGIVSKKKLIKSPAISFVVDENCDGCAYCVDPCPAHAITLIEYMQTDGNIKKTVEVNEAICKGCGICMATCPKKGIFVRHFKLEYFEEMIKNIREVV
jgi:heterodisulfide reductase subunit A